jgi:hypothetical protein
MNIGTTGKPYKLYVNGTSFMNNNLIVSGNMIVTNGSLYLKNNSRSLFTEDILFNQDQPDLFQDEYEGRSIKWKIAPDTNDSDKEWIFKYDKDGITIEDSTYDI